MKTNTTHPTKIGENTNTRNFFQKTFILLAILAFTSFGFKAKAQTLHFTVNNTAPFGCSWTIRVLDAFSVDLVTPFTSNGNSGVQLLQNCVSFSGTPAEIRVTRGLCTVSFFAPFTFTTFAPPCTGSCSTSIDCSGSTPSICGGGATDWVFVMQIQ